MDDYKLNLNKSDYVTKVIDYVTNAKHPFQFLSRVVHMYEPLEDQYTMIPVSMDASSCAYQIMSSFLLDEKLAVCTNFLKKDDSDHIYDLYESFIEDIKQDLVNPACTLKASLRDALKKNLTRKLVKAIFMPIVYGKTQHASAEDIYSELSFILQKNECYDVAAYLFKVWQTQNPAIVGLMSLFHNIGWFASYLNRPVKYDSYLLQTIKDYTVHKTTYVWLYDRKKKKRYQVTLSRPTIQRNKSKAMENYIR